jgi:hypothetical protein
VAKAIISVVFRRRLKATGITVAFRGCVKIGCQVDFGFDYELKSKLIS